ncbi:hypothetical protein M8J77_009182 [Diaphorina citri]|nr:hypothetical protein M8J77_009182 [Diaphorina citri]
MVGRHRLKHIHSLKFYSVNQVFIPLKSFDPTYGKYGTKRHSEDVDGDAFNDPPPTKTVPPPPPPSSQADGPRFSVEIVQQLEFVGSTSNCCTINTNVTVNTSIKSDTTSSSSRKGSPPDTGQGPGGGGNCHVGTNLIECKQEQPDNPEFVDLETCAAALEKDGASLTGLGEFLGDETNGINADAFKDLISEITDFHPEFMKDFNFDEKPSSKHQHVTNNNSLHSNHNHSPQLTHFKEEQPEPSPQQQNCKNGGVPMSQQYPAFPKSELSPAAQTLKHMAQQHQHKTQQMGINFNPIKQEVFNSNTFNGTNNSGPIPSPLPNKQSPGPPRPQMNNTPPAGFKQQYSPASPSYHHKQGPSPRPPSCPSSQASNPGSLIVNQAQSMHISSAQAQNIQVSMAQNVSTDMKPNMVSVAAQQGMFYSSSQMGPGTPPTPSVSDSGFCSVSQSQSVNFSQNGMRHRTPGPQHQAPPRHPGVDPKLLQQQQHSIMRSQLLQQQQQQGPPGQQVSQPRPPPPEYKLNPLQNMMPPHLQNVLMQQQRFSTVPPHQRPRPMQQPMPPSGPMMRPQHNVSAGPGGNLMQSMQQQQPGQRMYLRAQRPPNITPTEALTPSAEWRHMMAQQQAQQGGTNAGYRGGPASFQQMQGVMYNSGGNPGMQLSSMQMQQLPTSRSNNSNLPSMHHQSMNMQHSTSQMNLNLQMSQQSSMNNMNAFNSATGRNPQQPSNPSSTANSQQGHPGSMGNQNPMGNQQANPMGGQNLMGNQNPMGQGQNPMGQSQNSMGQGQNSMGQGQNPMGQSQNPMGQNQNPMGQNQNPMGQSQMSQQMNHMSSFAYQQHTGNQFGQHHMQQQTYISQQQQVSTPCSVSSGLNGLPSDFNLDFLDSHVTGGDSSFNDQDILRSLESGASFNLQDIL